MSEVRRDAVVLDDGSVDGSAAGAVRPSVPTVWAAGFERIDASDPRSTAQSG
ncbi:hypothetical protein ACH4MA_21580 [Streptomyces roseolus]|uniref:hypothetical protein n=1 Tax=Streptomyces roseolus TaxID=67358 RepID=UPI00378AD34A